MAIETEYKFAVNDKASLFSMLDELCPRKYSRQFQRSVMYDNPAGILQNSNARLRLRTLGETSQKQLTYKLPLANNNEKYKSETEFQIEFSDSNNNIESILNRIGFTPTTSYERYQTKWFYGSCHITLDEYPFADFIEIEGDPNNIKSVVNILKYDLNDALTSPVDTLFQMWLKANGYPARSDVVFSDFSNLPA